MMDQTDRFLRFLLRLLTTRSTLYTEMVSSNALVHHEDTDRFLDRNDDGSLVLQVGGADPAVLRRAAAVAAPYGYRAINLNCGCPSDRVAGAGSFGAALMRSPSLVAECCAALAEGAPGVPITVKCRIGVAETAEEARDADEARLADSLHAFVRTVSERGGVHHFALHARQA